MSHVTIFTNKQDSDRLIAALHKRGLVQFTKTSEKDVKEASMHHDVGMLAEYELRLSRVLELLKGYAPKRKGLRALMKSTSIPKRAALVTIEEKVAEASRLLEEIEPKVLEAEKTIDELQEQIDILHEQEKTLSYLSLFDIDAAWLGIGPYTIVTFGLTTDLNSIKEAGFDYFAHPIGDKKEERWAVLIVAHISRADDIARLRSFEERRVEGRGTPAELRAETSCRIEETRTNIENTTRSMADMYADYKYELLAIHEELHFEKSEKEIFGEFGETQYTFILTGWCLTEETKKVQTLVDEVTNNINITIFKEAPRNSVEAPIHLKNPRWAQPFETFLELFAIPKYNEVNPTMFIGIAFVLFFAFMLGDAGYGLLILLFSLYARIKFRDSTLIQKWAFVGILLGISTIILGIIFNSLFGDFIPRFIYGDANKPLYQTVVFGIEFPIDSIKKPVVVLAMALTLGLIHLNTGFVLGMYQNAKRRDIKIIFQEQIPWFFLQIGGGMLIGDIILKLWRLEGLTTIFAWLLTLAGLLFLFKRKGPLGFFDITGYLGDWLSYSRLLALGLATTGMAIAFNIVSEIFSNLIPFVGIILLPVMLIFLHFVNLLMQSLGAAVHSLRLQYIEFFARFFSGGGNKFIPFRIHRKYTEEVS